MAVVVVFFPLSSSPSLSEQVQPGETAYHLLIGPQRKEVCINPGWSPEKTKLVAVDVYYCCCSFVIHYKAYLFPLSVARLIFIYSVLVKSLYKLCYIDVDTFLADSSCC